MHPGTPKERAALAAERMTEARRGEALVAERLSAAGFRILARNLRIGRDEIDLLAIDPESNEVVIVEVKTRRRAASRAEDRVDAAKRRRLSRAALRLSLRSEFRGRRFRFDVCSVGPDSGDAGLVHFRSAFDAELG